MNTSQTNRLLGYPADARLLILNADDFGMCNSTNEAIMRTLQEGLIRSTTLMVPCPWAKHAMHFLADHPEIAFGVHLTVISDPADYSWGPVTPREKVPSLLNQGGYFNDFEGMPAFLAQVNLDELEMEFRAQIETVLAAGLKPDPPGLAFAAPRGQTGYYRYHGPPGKRIWAGVPRDGPSLDRKTAKPGLAHQ